MKWVYLSMGRIAISQLRKKKKITRITRPKAIASVSSTSLNDCRIFFVLSIKTFNSISDLLFFNFLQLFIKFIGNFDIIGARLWYNGQAHSIYTIIFPALFQRFGTQFYPGHIA